MAATAQYNVAMSPAEAFDYTREALAASGVTLGALTPPTNIDFSFTRKDMETGTIDAVMPGAAIVAPTPDGKSTVTLIVHPATQFIIYAVAIGFVALIFGSFIAFVGNLWLLLVLAAEGYLFWSIFNKWPNDALNRIRAKMQASSAVSGGQPIVAPSPAIVTPPPVHAAPAAANTATSNTAAIAEQIRHLAELRDQGHITQEEFDAKKAELLKRI